ncbi:MAG: hypothetical protein V4709_01710 [Pseudomonadota bacterium]
MTYTHFLMWIRTVTEMKLPVALLCLSCLLAAPARADIWLCVGANDRQSIQDKPCAKGMRQKSHVPDAPRRSASPPRVAEAGVRPPAKTPIEVGLQRNRTVICNLLNTEKADALAQISGSSAAPPGENPQDNLGKIEKQRTRVGCDAG